MDGSLIPTDLMKTSRCRSMISQFFSKNESYLIFTRELNACILTFSDLSSRARGSCSLSLPINLAGLQYNSGKFVTSSNKKSFAQTVKSCFLTTKTFHLSSALINKIIINMALDVEQKVSQQLKLTPGHRCDR